MADLKTAKFTKKQIELIAGCAAGILVILIVALALFRANTGKRYDRAYSDAVSAYAAGDYETALDRLDDALEIKATEEAYLLKADVYLAEDRTDMAIQVLYIGYSHVGSDRIAEKLESLKTDRSIAPSDPTPETIGTVTAAGRIFNILETSVVIGGETITLQDLQNLSSLTMLDSLSLSGDGITDIAPLSRLTNLTFLQISENEITDLTPLHALTRLKTLYMDSNPVSDFTPLYALSSLRTLSMKNIPITEEQYRELQEALPNCSIYCDEPEPEDHTVTLGGRSFSENVTELTLDGLGISDISELSRCKQLRKLDLRNNNISDLSPLVDLQNLQWVCLWNNKVSNLTPLMALKSITYLDLEDNAVSDIAPISYLSNLQELWLNGNPVHDISAVQYFPNLIKLGLKNTATDAAQLAVLANLTELRSLNIEGITLTKTEYEALEALIPECTITHSEILEDIVLGGKSFSTSSEEISVVSCGLTSLEGIEKCEDLKKLVLNNNMISDLSPLHELTALRILELFDNDISDLTPLSGLLELEELNLQNNNIADLTPLAACPRLSVLHLSNNRISNLLPLSTLTGLLTLDLDGNAISNLDGLSSLTSLVTLHLENNQIKTLSSLYTLTNLKALYLEGNPLDPGELEMLRIMLPNCVITADEEAPGEEEPEAPDPDSDPEAGSETQSEPLPDAEAPKQGTGGSGSSAVSPTKNP